MSDNKLISIIIPIYNVEKYLERCLESVICQTYRNLEIILINDGSTDNSSKICDKYAKKDHRIIVIHKENGGVSSARNRGIELAKGEYIGFVDSDDYIEPNMYEELYNEAVISDADIVMANYIVKTGKNEKKHFVDKGKDVLNKEKFYDNLLDNYFQGYLPTKLFNRRIIFSKNELILLNDTINIYEDLLFLANIAKNGNKFVFINKYLYNYCIRLDSAYNRYRSNYNSKQLSVLNAMDEMLKIAQQEAVQTVLKYKKAYLAVALQLLEQYYISDEVKEKDEKYIKDCAKKYYKEILRSREILFNQKVIIMIQYNCPKLVGKMKRMYHKIKN